MHKDLFPIIWNDFHFLRPYFLWLLVPVCLLIILSLISLQQQEKWQKIIAAHLRPYVIAKGNKRTQLLMLLSMLGAFVFAITALAGPTWKKVEIPGKQIETPVVLILDLSPSMLSTDIQPTRLERAKFKINDLIAQDPQAGIALVGFGGTAHTIIPFTKDYKIIKAHIETLSPKIMPFQGADLKAALTLADSITQNTDAPGTILLFADDFYSEEVKILSDFKQESKNNILILPFNTPKGANIKTDEFSYLDKQALSALHNIEGIEVHQLTLDNSDVEHIANIISSNLIFTEKDAEKDNEWNDAGILFMIPAALLFLLWFRRGWVLYSIVAISTLSSCSGNVQFKDLWYSKDYQGQLLSEAEKYKEAASVYNSPMRKGIAHYKAGNYEQAITLFSQDSTAEGAYNLGLAYFKTGEYRAAQLAFNAAVEKNPDFEMAVLNKKNIAQFLSEEESISSDNIEEYSEEKKKDNIENLGEDLSGGGQEATEEDMKKERKEESVSSDMHGGKELEDMPNDMEISAKRGSKILMRKVDDDPAIFLERKFRYQVKKYHIKPSANVKRW